MTLQALFEDFTVDVEVQIDAPPVAVWGLITDVARIGDFSPECVHAEWLDGATGPAVGARFAGTNRRMLPREFTASDESADTIAEWTRPCTVIACEQPLVFAYVVGDRFDESPASEWTFDVVPEGNGSRLRQRFRHLPEGRTGTRLQADSQPERAAEIVARCRPEEGHAGDIGPNATRSRESRTAIPKIESAWPRTRAISPERPR
jgi:hypothetical protein